MIVFKVAFVECNVNVFKVAFVECNVNVKVAFAELAGFAQQRTIYKTT